MAVKPLLKSGLRKSIGSGYNTQVWDEAWLPTIHPRPPSGIRPIQKPNMLGYELIDRSSKSWNMEVLISLFAPEDVSLICSMRISRSFKVDSFCWVHTKSGIYSVKTGYDEMCPLDNEQKLQACTQPSINGLLQQVWKVKTVPKIKHLMWQSLSNCLPVCSRLADRHCHQFGHVKDAGKTMRP